MKKILFTIILAFTAHTTFAQAELPNYKTAIGRFKAYYNNNKPDSLFNMFSPEVKAGLPIDKTKDLVNQMQAQLGPLQQTTFIKYAQTAAVYKADYKATSMLINLSLNKLNQVDGIYFNEYKSDKQAAGTTISGTINPQPAQTAATDPALTELPISLKTLGSTISGTLAMPKNAGGKIPVVLIIAGSGPTDRDGNSNQGLQTNTYKYIAEAFGKAVIASLRYDKRGIGQSTTSAKEADTKFVDFVDDASALISMLQDDKRFSKVIVLGHSEGSLIGMLSTAASETPLSAYISVSGAGVPADQILIEQMKAAPPSVSQEFKTILDSLKKGKIVKKVDPALYALARPSIQPYLMSWIRFDPQRVIKRVKVPVLIIQGTTDIQVTVADAEKLKKAKPEAVLKIIDGMNHVLKQAPADRQLNTATYNNPGLPLKPEFVTAIVDFVKGLK